MTIATTVKLRALLHTTYGHAVRVALFKSLPYDLERDFAPVSPMGFFDILVLVNKGSALVDSVRDLVRAAKAASRQVQRRHCQHWQGLICGKE